MPVLLDSCTAFCAAMNGKLGPAVLALVAVVLVAVWLRNCKRMTDLSLRVAAADKKADDALWQCDALRSALRAHFGEDVPKQHPSFVTWIEDAPTSDPTPKRDKP